MRHFYIALLISFFTSTTLFCQVTKKNEPHWIDHVAFYNGEINKDDITEGSFILLLDNQVNVPKQEVYSRITTKIIDNVGVQNASNIAIDYDPKYQELAVHKINIIRDGQVLDKLDVSNFQVMRREQNAEIFLYDGSLSAVMMISDVRTGDIIDYSYSVKGFNPLHKKFSHSFYLNGFIPFGKVHANILSANELNIKTYNTTNDCKISKKGNLHKYKWLNTNTAKIDFEEYTPEWELLYETVFVSEYNSWKEVVNWGLNVFETKEPISPELHAKINDIDAEYKTEGEKIKATLNFVQNDIRYLGLEYGIGGYKPFEPNTVFEQRFGDCKDKSLLMATMLNKMGIACYPMLVNTSFKNKVKEFLPSPQLFDHCVVKVIGKGNYEFWYDPTIPNQGGKYNTTYFPDYMSGLVLKKNNVEFDDIYSYFDNRVDTVEEFDLEEIGKGAHLKVTTSYYESEADNMRNYFKSNSINTIKKELEMFYSNYYYNIKSVNPPTYSDNKKENIFTLNEEYQLDSLWKPMLEKENHLSVTFLPTTLTNVIYFPKKNTRKGNLSMLYPMSKSHRIRVQLPANWDIRKESVNINSPGFYYELDVDYQRNENLVDIYHFLKIQKNHITPKEYAQYTKDVNKLDQSAGYYIYAPKNYTGLISSTNGENVFLNSIYTIFKFGIIIGILVAIGLFVFWLVNKNKTT